ncbi:signal peptide peptidase SppA [uncultured Eudoraea sp.]|uniref:signal peptide peptidase SppA n=1 Tax=uncultured Eudoraea sp. TaxID=1035614 RepID=UPI002608FD2E|nr:signal peptide peptidase SppA [uncultured Eudoraea sp.]
MNFLRNLLAAILGTLIAFGMIFFMFIIFVNLLNAEETVTVKKNSVLELKLKNPIADFTGSDDADPFGVFFDEKQGLDEILHAIKVAKGDKEIKGISINNNYISAGISTTRAIRNALADFKESGKFIYAYGDYYPQKDYYLASIADSIFINPVGALDFKGLAAEVLYFKDLQDKTGVKMEVIRHGKYKSAVEPFLSNEMSEANRSQIKELMGSIWNSIITEIEEERGITKDNINIIADTLGGRKPEYAKKSGLLDDVIYYDEYENRLKHALGIDTSDKLNSITLQDYTKVSNKKKLQTGKDRIAIIFAQGDIIYGEGDPDFIGQGIMSEAIIKARDDKSVKAIVLRVNSPGGSALASDIIWREIELAKEKKPVVVSMGDVAASGGYYISAGANKIFAEPTTITGSIGVFGVIPNINKLAGNIGINAEQVGTNKNSVDYSLFEPMSDEFRGFVKEGIEKTYQTFLQKVAEGRNITIAEADSIAQGRVWSGAEAMELGLVDQLGGLEDAIEEAAVLADVDTYSIRKYPRYKTSFERFMEDFGGASMLNKEQIIRNELGTEVYGIYREVKSAMEQQGIQARLPFTLTIK